jgi:hypothetical protein
MELRSPHHFFVALSCFISFSDFSAVIVMGHDVLFKFMENFINCFGFFHVKCEAVGPGVRPLISALIVVLSSTSGIWDLCCMNLLTKFRNGSLSFCLQLYKSDDSVVVSWNIWNACLNFVLRST